LYRGMADKFAQALVSYGMALKGFVYHLIEYTSLDTNCATNSSGVIHDDACQDNRYGKSG